MGVVPGGDVGGALDAISFAADGSEAKFGLVVNSAR